MITNHRIDVHGESRPGRIHEKNHDHFAIATLNKSVRMHQTNLELEDEARVHGENQGHLFLVADGVSGGPAPSRASRTAIDAVVRYFVNELPWMHMADGEPEDVRMALADAVRDAQSELLGRAVGEAEGMGTTLTLAFVAWPDLYVAHVGDSRCYLQRGTRLEQLTTDHTLAEMRRDAGAKAGPGMEKLLWNALGGAEDALQPEIRHYELKPQDRILLLTDGAVERNENSRLSAILSEETSAQERCAKILQRDSRDDRTAIVVQLPGFEPEAAAQAEQPDEPELAVRADVPRTRPSDREARPPGTPRRDMPIPA